MDESQRNKEVGWLTRPFQSQGIKTETPTEKRKDEKDLKLLREAEKIRASIAAQFAAPRPASLGAVAPMAMPRMQAQLSAPSPLSLNVPMRAPYALSQPGPMPMGPQGGGAPVFMGSSAPQQFAGNGWGHPDFVPPGMLYR